MVYFEFLINLWYLDKYITKYWRHIFFLQKTVVHKPLSPFCSPKKSAPPAAIPSTSKEENVPSEEVSIGGVSKLEDVKLLIKEWLISSEGK